MSATTSSGSRLVVEDRAGQRPRDPHKLIDPSLVPDHLYGEIASLIYEGLVARALGTVPAEQQHP